jgi:SAM-dependent methyltransferase
MLAIVEELGPARVLDVGCGEGRFCRMLADRGIITTGIDPTAALIDHRLMLTHVDEPPATGGPPDKRDRYNRVPNFHIMAWRKPA